LHGQLDTVGVSRKSKVQGREPISMHPDDAAARGVGAGDVVRVFNDHGALLAGVVLDEVLLPGVVRLSTGAWFDAPWSEPLPPVTAPDPPTFAAGS
jgi:biotin/methionine sulfoxide reductase